MKQRKRRQKTKIKREDLGERKTASDYQKRQDRSKETKINSSFKQNF